MICISPSALVIMKVSKKDAQDLISNLKEDDKIRYKEDIKKNREHLNSLKNKTSIEWREYATQCMIEIIENKKQS